MLAILWLFAAPAAHARSKAALDAAETLLMVQMEYSAISSAYKVLAFEADNGRPEIEPRVKAEAMAAAIAHVRASLPKPPAEFVRDVARASTVNQLKRRTAFYRGPVIQALHAIQARMKRVGGNTRYESVDDYNKVSKEIEKFNAGIGRETVKAEVRAVNAKGKEGVQWLWQTDTMLMDQLRIELKRLRI